MCALNSGARWLRDPPLDLGDHRLYLDGWNEFSQDPKSAFLDACFQSTEVRVREVHHLRGHASRSLDPLPPCTLFQTLPQRFLRSHSARLFVLTLTLLLQCCLLQILDFAAEPLLLLCSHLQLSAQALCFLGGLLRDCLRCLLRSK